MTAAQSIVGLGEALFDLFPDGDRLGGAPLNVAVHAQQLGNTGVVVSRVGQDRLGDAVLAALRDRSMPIDHVQTDPDRPTGTVRVDLSNPDEPRYTIDTEVAWDYMQWDGDLDTLAAHCDGVCFGTLAQRCAQSRSTIFRFVEAARRAVRLLDVNARGELDRRELTRSLEISSALKLNADELQQLRALYLLPEDDEQAAAKLRKQFTLDWVAVTRGKDGTTVYTDGATHTGDKAYAAPGGDPVGAGDATSAALLHGAARGWDWPRTITLANMLGAHVASHPGACPELTAALRVMAGIPVPAAESAGESAGGEGADDQPNEGTTDVDEK